MYLKKEGFKIRGAKLVKREDKSYFHPLKEDKINMDSLLIETGNPFLRELTLSNYLKVTYNKEMNEITNQEDQVSWLKINKGKKVIINANGLVNDDNTALISYGYWYWNSADEWLPYDYQNKSQ